MKRPKSYNRPKFKKGSIIGAPYLPEILEVLSSRDLCRMVIDFKVKDLSHHEIEDFFARGLHLPITQPEIEAILLAAGTRAKQLNGIYDAQVHPHIETLEFDEIFQGRENCYLGCADAASHYLFMLEWIEGRSEDTLRRIMVALGDVFDEVKLIITDGLKAYSELIPETFEKAVHLFCTVHAFRIILREQEEVERGARKAYAKLKDLRTDLTHERSKIYAKRQKIKRRKRQLTRWIQKQDDYYRNYGIKKNAKKEIWTPERIWIKERLNFIRAMIRSQEKTLREAEEDFPKMKLAIAKAENAYLPKKQDALQSGRLVGEFKALLKSSPDDYSVRRAKFEQHLNGNSYSIAGKLRKFLKEHPEMFTTKTPYLDALCPPSMANTNIIESIFGRIRPFLKKARRFRPTPIATALFEIVRLRYNLTSPYTGPNRCQSPLERAGIRSKYRDYLDALLPPTREINYLCSSLFNPGRKSQSRLKRFNLRTKSILAAQT